MADLGSMYRVSPFYQFSTANVELPDVMYKAPTYIGQQEASHKVSDELKGLKLRQEKLLHDLDALLKKVSGTIAQSKASTCPAVPKTATQSKQVVQDVVEDIVLHVDPSCPPHSLKYFCPLLKQRCNVALKVHCHSSLVEPFSLDDSFISEECERSKQKLIITIIWKPVSGGLLTFTSPSKTIPMKGEPNLGRLLGRLLGIYDGGSDTLSSTAAADFCFDACDVLSSSATSAQEKAAALDGLNARLDKQQWFGGSKPSIADAVTLSALKSMQLGKYRNLRRWCQNGQVLLTSNLLVCS